MNRENEQFAASIGTDERVINYLVDVKKMSEDEILELVMDDEPTQSLINELRDVTCGEEFMWGDSEY